ncbi:MAG: guanylate kinase [Proteobacteria bacterium]|nr:guanylate kinase [Pseudomonadota bacterium]
MSDHQPFYVVVAPSGAGKSSLIYALLEKYGDAAALSVSYTTRPAREGEKDGLHYYFTNNQHFEGLIADGKLLEWAKVHKWYYGTAKSEIERIQNTGKKAILEVDIQGLEQLIALSPLRVRSLFICPPSIEEMARRLKKRGTTSSKELTVRFASAKKELEKADLCDDYLINQTFEESLEMMAAWIFQDQSPLFRKADALALVKTCLKELDQREYFSSHQEIKYG